MLTTLSSPSAPSLVKESEFYSPFDVALIFLNKTFHATISPYSSSLRSSSSFVTQFNHFKHRAFAWVHQEDTLSDMDAFYEPLVSPWVFASRKKLDLTIVFASNKRISVKILNTLVSWFYGTLFIASLNDPMPENILDKWFRRYLRQMRGFLFPFHAVPFHPLPFSIASSLRPKLLAYVNRLQALVSVLLVDGKVSLFSNEWFNITDLERSLILGMTWRFLSHSYFDHPILLHDTAPHTSHQLIGVKLTPNLYSVSVVKQNSVVDGESIQRQIIPLLWNNIPQDLHEPKHTVLDLNVLSLLFYFEKQQHWLFPFLPHGHSSKDIDYFASQFAVWLQLLQLEKDEARPFLDEMLVHPTFQALSESIAPQEYKGYFKYFSEVQTHVWMICKLDLPDYALKRVATECLTYFLKEVLM